MLLSPLLHFYFFHIFLFTLLPMTFTFEFFFVFSLVGMLFVYPDDVYDDYLASLLQKFDSRERLFSFFGNFKI